MMPWERFEMGGMHTSDTSADWNEKPPIASVNKKVVALLFIFALALFLLPHLLDSLVVPKGWDGWWFVAQMLAGNWSPPEVRPGPLTNYWFLFVAEVAIVVNISPYLFLWELIRRVSKIERKQEMELTQVLSERDSAIITVLLSTVPREKRGEAATRFRRLFSDGHNFWINELVPAGHDPDTAAEIIDAIKSAKFGPG
jgi:hypothetical protein